VRRLEADEDAADFAPLFRPIVVVLVEHRLSGDDLRRRYRLNFAVNQAPTTRSRIVKLLLQMYFQEPPTASG
jgi:hypothetical protein